VGLWVRVTRSALLQQSDSHDDDEDRPHAATVSRPAKRALNRAYGRIDGHAEEGPAVRIDVLGPLRVVADTEIDLPRASHRRLLSILALDAGRRVSTDVLIDRNWGETAPATAKAALQTHVSALRKLLPTDVLVTEGYGYRLDLDGHECDADELAELVVAAREAAASNQWLVEPSANHFFSMPACT
jgi:two-component SAPR family response regulator